MPNKEYHLFVISSPSRADALAEPGENQAIRRMLEEAWAERIGMDLEKLKAADSATEVTSEQKFTSSTISGSDTQNGLDVTTDTTSDTQTVTMTDGMKNDG